MANTPEFSTPIVEVLGAFSYYLVDGLLDGGQVVGLIGWHPGTDDDSEEPGWGLVKTADPATRHRLTVTDPDEWQAAIDEARRAFTGATHRGAYGRGELVGLLAQDEWGHQQCTGLFAGAGEAPEEGDTPA